MKKASIAFLALAVITIAALLSSCGKPKPTLHIYNWGDYMSDEIVQQFEEEFNCRVKIDVFDSNEAMYAKLKAGAGGYDIIVPSSYMAKVMYDQNMITKLDLSKMPNVVKFIDKSYSNLALDADMEYTVPYFVSFTGIGYDTTHVKDFKPTWHMFEDSSLDKRCSLLNDQREVLGVALRTLGYDVNSINQEEVNAAVDLVKNTWKPHIAKFEVDDAKRALASGEFYLIQTYSGDMLQVIMERPEIAFVIPEEGSTVTFDNFAITSSSQNKDLAYQFIDFIYRPDVCAANMNEIMYITPHTAAVKLVDDSLRSNPAFNIPPKIRSRCIPLKDLGEKNVMYNTAWELIRQE